jgi:hypothetical protein
MNDNMYRNIPSADADADDVQAHRLVMIDSGEHTEVGEDVEAHLTRTFMEDDDRLNRRHEPLRAGDVDDVEGHRF